MRNIYAALAAATVALACALPVALAQSEDELLLRGLVRAAEIGKHVISVEVRDSLFDKDGKFGAGSGPKSKLVDVVFEGSPNLTTGMTRRGIENDMVDGYEAIYTAGVPVHSATIEAHMTIIDARGNEFLGNVYGTKLNGEAARGVNWSNKDITDWGNVWTVYAMNRAFR